MGLRKGDGGVEQEGCNKKSVPSPPPPPWGAGDWAHVLSFPKF